MTKTGGAARGVSRLVVVAPTPKPHPVDVTPAVHRMRAASLDAQWHVLLDGVYAHTGFLNP